MPGSINYRLALVIPRSRQILATGVAGDYFLPYIAVPRWERAVPNLTQVIAERWKIRSIVLDILTDEFSGSPCAVIEVRSFPMNCSEAGFTSVDLNQIGPKSLNARERSTLCTILAGTDEGLSPFSRIGWIDDVLNWIHEVTNRGYDRLTGDFLQLTAGGGFCLIRIATSFGPAYWLKAAGFPNMRELSITQLLSVACPQYLPRIIATREDWNAWLMEEHGSSLYRSASVEDFKRAVHDMAELQKHMVGKVDSLFDAKCDDHRTETISSYIPDLITYLDEAMALQVSTVSPRLSTHRLKSLETMLLRACSLQQDLEIPDSIMHNDVNPANILYDGNRCTFIDWCEVSVGNPFITSEQVALHASRNSPDPAQWTNLLREECKNSWVDLLAERQIKLALQLAPLLSILSALHGRGDWLDSPERYAPNRLSKARSLARHIDRVSHTPPIQEALCQ